METENTKPWTPDALSIELTRNAEAQLNRDPMADIRPVIDAMWATVREMAPMIPNALIGKALTEHEVFRFLECLERHGYRVVRIE